MDKQIIIYISIGVAIYLILSSILKIFGYLLKESHEERKKKREAKRLEKLKWKYAKVKLDNPLLNSIIKTRFIIFEGQFGKGKTILMNLVTHFIVKKQEKENKKNKRYNKVMRPEYYADLQELKKNKLLPVYSNLEFTEKGKHKQELLPFFCLHKKAVHKAIFTIDEFSSLFPKEMYYETQGSDNPLFNEIKEMVKKIRHYLDGHILGTEQGGEDIWIGMRKNGYLKINCLDTIVKLSKFGKFSRKVLNTLNFILPAFLTTNLVRQCSQKLFLRDRIVVILKSFLPSYFLLPNEFYKNKQKINNFIKSNFQRFATRFQFENGEYYIRFTNKDIYKYDTRAYASEYTSLFNKRGERKQINES